MEQLVILDYSNQSVHIYNVDSEADVDESYINNIGFHTSECTWMFGENINIQFHKDILKWKKIEEEVKYTEVKIKYKAVDGTTFKYKEECIKYEETALCVLNDRVRKLIVAKESDAWTLMGNDSDNGIVGMKFKTPEDINTFLQLLCLQRPCLTRDEYQKELKQHSDKCYEAMNNDDILLVGINHEDYCIIDTRNKIVNNLINFDKDETEQKWTWIFW